MWYYAAMSDADRLINKFLSRKNITVEDCDKLLSLFGYGSKAAAAIAFITGKVLNL
jgi:hypothetical protein